MIASLEDLMRQSQSQAESLAHLQEVLAQELDGAKSPLAAPSAEDKSQHFAELDTAVGAKIAAIEEDVAKTMSVVVMMTPQKMKKGRNRMLVPGQGPSKS